MAGAKNNGGLGRRRGAVGYQTALAILAVLIAAALPFLVWAGYVTGAIRSFGGFFRWF